MNIIVTGAGKGIGNDLVKIFARDTRNRILAISRNENDLKDLKEYTLDETPGANVQILSFNLTNDYYGDIKNIVSDFESVDILINNAAQLINKPFIDLDDDDWKSIYEINLFAPARLVRELMSKLGKKNTSHVINIGSMGGFQGSAKFPGLSAYSSSKAALANLTECLSEELKDENIAFNCLALGAVGTEMLKEAFPDYSPPLKSEEMAEFIANFALNGHQFIRGKVIPVSLTTP